MNTNEEANFFKQKRDEYLVEIRKKKVTDQLQAKRIKLALASENLQGSLNNEQQTMSLAELASNFITLTKAGNLKDLQSIATGIRLAVSQDDNPPISELINTGAVPYILELIKPEFYEAVEVLRECSWIAANIASYETQNLIDLDIIPLALHLLNHPDQDVKENAIWILSNIAAESTQLRNTLIKKGITTKIDEIFDDPTLTQPVANNLAWLMSNLCRGKPYPEFGEVNVASFLSYLEKFIRNSQDEEVLFNCMTTLTYLTDTDDEQQIQEILDMNISKEMIMLLKGNYVRVKGPTVKTIGNLICNSDSDLDELVNEELLEALFPLLDDPRKLVRKDVCWTYSNILADSSSFVEMTFAFENGKIIEKLLHMAIHDDQKEVAEKCLYALTNACEIGSIHEIQFLVEHQFIELIVEVLKQGNQKDIMEACLSALESILTEGQSMCVNTASGENPYFVKFAQCDGVTVLENLQNFGTHDMCKKVEEILREYVDREGMN